MIEDPKILENVAPTAPIMLFGGESLSEAHKFDAIREISNMSGQRDVGARSENLIDVVLGAMAGVTFFETNFPLELALKGFALKSYVFDSSSLQRFIEPK